MGHRVRRKLVLTGGRAGQTVALGGYQFVDGVTFVEGDSENIEGVCTYLGKTYKAFQEGSMALAHYQGLDYQEAKRKKEAKADGKRDTQTIARPGSEVPSDVSSGQQGSSEVPEADGSGAAGATADGRGSEVPERDGSSNAGNDGSAAQPQGILDALKQLNPKNDEHWTNEGRPRIDAVERILGDSTITRARINEVAPDFVRPE